MLSGTPCNTSALLALCIFLFIVFNMKVLHLIKVILHFVAYRTIAKEQFNYPRHYHSNQRKWCSLEQKIWRKMVLNEITWLGLLEVEYIHAWRAKDCNIIQKTRTCSHTWELFIIVSSLVEIKKLNNVFQRRKLLFCK